jgi:hypothetical protein
MNILFCGFQADIAFLRATGASILERLKLAVAGCERAKMDRQDRILREWLLLLLRFAITREHADQSAALTMAEELDSLGARWKPAAPRFFVRTTTEVCEAIVAVNDEQRDTVLQKHLARIDDPRLKRAFRSTVSLQSPPEPPRQSAKGRRGRTSDLWKGLQER